MLILFVMNLIKFELVPLARFYNYTFFQTYMILFALLMTKPCSSFEANNYYEYRMYLFLDIYDTESPHDRVCSMLTEQTYTQRHMERTSRPKTRMAPHQNNLVFLDYVKKRSPTVGRRRRSKFVDFSHKHESQELRLLTHERQ